jgi:hypothetical protein
VNRNNLSQYPNPYYTCSQFSSYDRATIKKGVNSWFSNWDRSMFIRIDTIKGRKEYVMMDAKGPGAIVRFWMTFSGKNSGNGILRLYLDDASTPCIEGRALDIISGGSLVGPPLSTSVSDLSLYNMRGHNLYLPIPYKKRCIVTYESDNIKDFGAKTGGESVYYNINYRTYIKGTNLNSFSLQDLEVNKKLISKIQKQLRLRTKEIPQDASTEKIIGKVAPGASISKKIIKIIMQ